MAITFRIDVSAQDLIDVTRRLHILKPSTRDRVVIGVREPNAGDQNVIFHMSPKDNGDEEESVVMLSAQYIIEMLGDGAF